MILPIILLVAIILNLTAMTFFAFFGKKNILLALALLQVLLSWIFSVVATKSF